MKQIKENGQINRETKKNRRRLPCKAMKGALATDDGSFLLSRLLVRFQSPLDLQTIMQGSCQFVQ